MKKQSLITWGGPNSTDVSIWEEKMMLTEGRSHGIAHVKTESEIGVMLLQVYECLEPPEAKRSKEGSPLIAQREGGPADILLFCSRFHLRANLPEKMEKHILETNQLRVCSIVWCYSLPLLMIMWPSVTDFRLLASRTVKGYISLVCGHITPISVPRGHIIFPCVAKSSSVSFL